MPPKSDQSAYIVRHGAMRFLGQFTAPPTLPNLRRSDRVILSTERGQELGEVLILSTPQIYASIPDVTHGAILRMVGPDDTKKIENLKTERERSYTIAVELVHEHRLAMQIIDVEHIYGGERLTIYFLSENRVDFRELQAFTPKCLQALLVEDAF